MSASDAPTSNNQDRVTNNRVIFWLTWSVCLILYITFLGTRSVLGLIGFIVFFALTISPIRFIKDKGSKTFFSAKSAILRIRNCRSKYKIRSIISMLLFIFFGLPGIMLIYDNILAENFPSPVINLLSKEGNIGNQTGYSLIFNLEGADEVSINRDKVIRTGKNYQKWFSLEGNGNSSLIISIEARNKHKTTEKTVRISRNKTQEDIETEKLQIENAKIETIESYINELKKGYEFNTVATIAATAYRLEGLGSLIKGYLENESNNVVNKAKEAKTLLISKQKSIFPSLRNEWCSITKDTMWRLDVDVKCSGGTVKFIGGAFAANRNIADGYSAIKDMLYLLRFKQARFYRYEGSDSTYYTIGAPSDITLK